MITKEDIKKVAELAMLKLNEEDAEKFYIQFNEILNYMKEMDNIDLSNQEAAFHITKMSNVFREDKAESSISNDKALTNAPKGVEGFFKVPRVI